MNRLEEAKSQLDFAQAEWAAKKADYERAALLAHAARSAMNKAAQCVQDARAAVHHEQLVISITNWARPDLDSARRLLSTKLSELDAVAVLPLKDLGILEGQDGALRYNTSRRALARRILDELEDELEEEGEV